MAELKVLFATSEVAPLIKTGGLADVSGALPAALRAIGVDVRVLVPGYSQVIEQLANHDVVANFDDLPGFPSARLLSGAMANDVPLFVLDCPALYQRAGGPYQNTYGHDWPDNALRFGLLSKAGALLGNSASPLAWRPDLVHCNDWQTGLTPAYLHFATGSVPSIISIHNLAFQGRPGGGGGGQGSANRCDAPDLRHQASGDALFSRRAHFLESRPNRSALSGQCVSVRIWLSARPPAGKDTGQSDTNSGTVPISHRAGRSTSAEGKPGRSSKFATTSYLFSCSITWL